MKQRAPLPVTFDACLAEAGVEANDPALGRIGRLACLGGVHVTVAPETLSGAVNHSPDAPLKRFDLPLEDDGLMYLRQQEEEKDIGAFGHISLFLQHHRPHATLYVDGRKLWGGDTTPRAFAKRLDAEVATSLREAAHYHLIKTPTARRELRSAVLAAVVGGEVGGLIGFVGTYSDTASITEGLEATIVPGAAAALIVAAAAHYGSRAWVARYTRQHPENDKPACWSLLPGAHYDRYALVSALTRGTRLVRAAKPNQTSGVGAGF